MPCVVFRQPTRFAMLGNSNEAAPRTRDSFFDDDNENENTTPRAPPPISAIRIVTSKPPVYRRQSDSSDSPSPSSCCSDRDVTDVSSLGGGDHHHHHHHHQSPPKQQDKRQQHSDHDQHHPFHLQSMRHVLLGSSAATSRPPSPAHPHSQLNKKHVRIVTDETDKNLHHHSQHQQPYIHGHTKDYRRVRLTSSALNRQKQQQRIERENMRLLERLQQTRASRGLKRDELLTHYDHQMGYTTYSMPSAPPRDRLSKRPSSATMMTSDPSAPQGKPSTHSRPSSASHAMNGNQARSRPVSATSSQHGSSRASSARRPIWNDRWQQQE